MQSEQPTEPEKQCESLPSEILNRQLHDLKATAAIAGGFVQALDTSLQALASLRDESTELVDSPAASLSAERRGLEADCVFCLSRIDSSVKQLKGRLDTLSVNLKALQQADSGEC